MMNYAKARVQHRWKNETLKGIQPILKELQVASLYNILTGHIWHHCLFVCVNMHYV